MRNDSVDLWSIDEVHFQQHGSRCRMWIPPEIKDPVLLHAPTRKSVGYFGAVRLRDGRFVFRQETGKFGIGHGHTRHGLGRLSAEMHDRDACSGSCVEYCC